MGISVSRLRSRGAALLATFFFVGRAPYAPGTLGSLACLPLWYGASANVLWHGALLILLLPLSYWATGIYQVQRGEHDSKEIVIDEVLGMGVAFLGFSQEWPLLVASFVLFRIFDIAKPFPINYIDRRYKSAWAVIGDDLLAGLFANLVLRGLLWIT